MKVSQIYGAFAWQVDDIENTDFSEFPTDDAKFINFINGHYNDISELPAIFVFESMKLGANVITLGQGDHWKIYTLSNPIFECPNCGTLIAIPMSDAEDSIAIEDETVLAEEWVIENGKFIAICPNCGAEIETDLIIEQ